MNEVVQNQPKVFKLVSSIYFKKFIIVVFVDKCYKLVTLCYGHKDLLFLINFDS